MRKFHAVSRSRSPRMRGEGRDEGASRPSLSLAAKIFNGVAPADPLRIAARPPHPRSLRSRTRAADVSDLPFKITDLITNLIASWDLPDSEKKEELATTKILFAGWSWKHQKFDIGVFDYRESKYKFLQRQLRLGHPWYEKSRSLLFIGDYEDEYLDALRSTLTKRHGQQKREVRKYIDFDYEPVEALHALLNDGDTPKDRPAIGGAPQLLKIYSHCNCVPIVIRVKEDAHFLLGRRLFTWEKTEYPVLDLSGNSPSFMYPMSHIPLPNQLEAGLPEAQPDMLDRTIP